MGFVAISFRFVILLHCFVNHFFPLNIQFKFISFTLPLLLVLLKQVPWKRIGETKIAVQSVFFLGNSCLHKRLNAAFSMLKRWRMMVQQVAIQFCDWKPYISIVQRAQCTNNSYNNLFHHFSFLTSNLCIKVHMKSLYTRDLIDILLLCDSTEIVINFRKIRVWARRFTAFFLRGLSNTLTLLNYIFFQCFFCQLYARNFQLHHRIYGFCVAIND